MHIAPQNYFRRFEMSDQVIHIGLYGGKGIFGGKETPQRAETITCDRFNECSYYKSGHCLNVTSPFSNCCKYGHVSISHGYTSRARRYYEFGCRFRNDEKYNKLSHPPKKLGLIGDMVVFPYAYIRINETENGELNIDNPGFGNNMAVINYEKFTAEFIKKLCSFRPQAIMGGTIRDYQDKEVFLFLAHLKEVLPERHAEVKAKYPELVYEISYIGRKALLKTIAPSYVTYESRQYAQFDEKWRWDGETLMRESGYVSSFNVTKDYEVLEVKIKPSDKSVVKISSNEQVTENTVFID
jgi:hypothetical protein